jgi:hypothetical protein
MTRFLIFSYFCILATYVLNLVCTKQICSLNVIVHRLAEALNHFYNFVTFIAFGYNFSELYAQ